MVKSDVDFRSDSYEDLQSIISQFLGRSRSNFSIILLLSIYIFVYLYIKSYIFL
jgi:hypothetical protein